MPSAAQLRAIARKKKAEKILAYSLINPKVVRAFRERKLEDHTWMKALPRGVLEDFIVESGFPEIYLEPYLHQLVCLCLGIVYPRFMWLLDMGLGKTSILLNLIRYHQIHSGLKQTLVLVPSAVNVESWAKQIAIHRPDLSYVKLLGTHEEREELINEDADLALMNYAGLTVYMTEMRTKKSTRKPRAMTPIASKVKKFVTRFNGSVFDESHKLGNQDSLVWRLCNRTAKNVVMSYGATGTLFGRRPERAFPQFKLIDGGQTLGETLAIFRQAFMQGKPNRWGAIDWKFPEESKPLLNKVIQHRSIRYEDAECQDLPPMIEETIRVPLTDEQKLYYNRAVNKMKEVRGDWRALDNLFIRTRQITAGFLGMKDKNDDRAELEFGSSAKLEALEMLLENVPVGSKVVIFHEFRPTGPIIERLLTKLGVKYASLRGKIKNPIAQYNSFLNDPSITALVANSASGGTGIDELQKVSRFVVFYELPVDPATYKQAVKRVYRTGQKNRVYKYILEAIGTVDGDIWDMIVEGRNLFDAIVEGRHKLRALT